MPTDSEVGEKTQVTDSPWRDQGGMFSPDGRYIAYLSDESKEQEVWVFDRTANARKKVSARTRRSRNRASGRPTRRSSRTAAAIGCSWSTSTPAASTELAYNQAGGYQLSGFSPDGNWLVYTRRDDDQNAEVFCSRSRRRSEHNVTANPFNDSRGTVTPDGNGWSSSRIATAASRISSSVPLVRQKRRSERSARQGASEEGARRASAREQNATAPAPPAAAPAPLDVETEGIGRRAVQLTRGEQAIQAYFLSADGRLIYFRSTDERGPGLFSITIDGTDRRRVTEGAFAGLDADERPAQGLLHAGRARSGRWR